MVKKIKLFKAIFLAIAGISTFHFSNTNPKNAGGMLHEIKNSPIIKYSIIDDNGEITLSTENEGSFSNLSATEKNAILCSGNKQNEIFYVLYKGDPSQVYNVIEKFNKRSEFKISCYMYLKKDDPQIYPVAKTES